MFLFDFRCPSLPLPIHPPLPPPPLRLEGEAAKGSEALLAASQEREATLAASLQELRSAMGDLADEAADREDALRRQVGSEVGGSVGGGLQADGGGLRRRVCVCGGEERLAGGTRGVLRSLVGEAIYPPREVRPPSPTDP